MDKIINKLKSTSGESIGEVLVSTLIAGLALMILALMIASTSKLVTKSKTFMNDYVVAENRIVEPTVSPDGSATVAFKDSVNTITLTDKYTSASPTITVNLYINKKISSKKVVAYTKQPKTTPSGNGGGTG